jgi:beta-glucosidase-like glycosyl hydrolase
VLVQQAARDAHVGALDARRRLRREWGFTGIVVSDWGAGHDTVESASVGLDVEMPGPPIFRGPRLVDAVRSRRVAEEAVDEKVLGILRLARRTGALGDPERDRSSRRSAGEAAAVLRRAAAESFVLLENHGVLPIGSGNFARKASSSSAAGAASRSRERRSVAPSWRAPGSSFSSPDGRATGSTS